MYKMYGKKTNRMVKQYKTLEKIARCVTWTTFA